jgi:transposase InsO family protein
LFSHNGLWYHENNGTIYHDFNPMESSPIIHRLTQAAQYELYHQRFGHPGERIMSILHHHIDDVPPLQGNTFYKCTSCVHAKCHHRSMNVSNNVSNNKHSWTKDWSKPPSPELPSPESDPSHQPGQNFHMDFGFMRGSGFDAKDKEGNTITSIDGYRSYLLIIDKCSQYTWVFLAKTKTPPIIIIETFLQQHGNPNTTHRTIRTDKGSELWGSYSFQEAILKANFILEPTAPDAPAQNGIAERPNQTLSTMVRCLLHSANLGHEYWSFALLHAVYLKNRLPHSSINTTPTKNTPENDLLQNTSVFLVVQL